MATLIRRVGLGLATVALSGAAVFGGAAAAHAAGDQPAQVQDHTYIEGWNNGDGTSTFITVKCRGGVCTGTVRVVKNLS